MISSEISSCDVSTCTEPARTAARWWSRARPQGRKRSECARHMTRHLTRRALGEKLAHERVIAVRDPSCGVVALLIQFDTDFAGWPLPSRCRFYLSYFSVSGPSAALGAILHTFARSARSTDEQSGEALTTALHPRPPPGSACTVHATADAADAAAAG